MRIANKCWFETHDGTPLFYRYWPSIQDEPQRALILLHRGHEHSGRLQHLVDELDLPETAMFAWDARGHGHSTHALEKHTSLATFVKDLDVFARHISDVHGIPFENIAIVAQSVGSVLAAAWVHDYAPAIRCMVLASPAFKVKLYLPFARAGLSFLHRIFGDFRINSYVKAAALTHDPRRIASYKADPLIMRPISVRVLLGLYSASDRIVADAEAIQIPTQLLISGSDFVVERTPQDEFFERLGATVKEKHLFKHFYHDTLGEKDRALAIGKAREFILRMFELPIARTSLHDSDQNGYTKNEYDKLCLPLPWSSPRALGFALAKIALRTIGRLSDGIQLGIETGFDSGSTLDYVYKNKPSGITRIGKRIDQIYLSAAGWQGIRVRKENVEKALRRCVAMLRVEDRPVCVLDIAAGHGRYVLDALEHELTEKDRILLRDYSEENVRAGRTLIQQRGLDGISRFEKGNAFDRQSLVAIQPAPTLTVVSGLYELFPENEPLRQSLAGLAAAMPEGSYLVYTGQPWHPQLEPIARMLTSHRDHRPWIMRRRTQAELDELVRAAGFLKVDESIDDWGIFTVSIARRQKSSNNTERACSCTGNEEPDRRNQHEQERAASVR